MSALVKFCRWIDALNTWVGRIVAWATALVVGEADHAHPAERRGPDCRLGHGCVGHPPRAEVHHVADGIGQAADAGGSQGQ